MREVEALFDAPEKSPEADRLEVLSMLVEKYEAQHYPIPAPDPIDFLNYAMETRGLTRKDLEAYIGSRGRSAEPRPPADPRHDPALVRRLEFTCGCTDCGLRIAAGRIEHHAPDADCSQRAAAKR